MYPTIIEMEIKQDTTGKWRVFLNGACAVRFFEKESAIQYVDDVKELNQGKEIVVTVS